MYKRKKKCISFVVVSMVVLNLINPIIYLPIKGNENNVVTNESNLNSEVKQSFEEEALPLPEEESKEENSTNDNSKYYYNEMTQEEIDAQNSMIPELKPFPKFDLKFDNYKSKQRAAVPGAYDSRNYNLVTSVKNQNPLGTCWALSTTGTVETSMIKKGMANSNVNLSERALAYFSYNNVADPLGLTNGDYTIGYGGGGNWAYGGFNTVAASLTMMKGVGPIDEGYAPYSAAPVPNHLAYGYNSANIRNTIMTGSSNKQRIKELILQYGAGTFDYLHINGNLNNASGAYFVPANRPGYFNNHSVTIVGWDDNYPKEYFNSWCRPSSNGAFIIKNSFGPGYGAGGYFYVSYEDLSFSPYNSAPVMFYDVDNKDKYDNIYQYDGTSYPSQKFVSAGTSIINQFNVKASDIEALNQVSIHSFTANSSFEIQIYKNPTNLNVPTSGEKLLASPKKVGIYDAGFYTFDLDSEILLKRGDVYSIEVKTLQDVYIGVDTYVPYGGGDLAGFGGYNHAEANQSFLQFKDGTISDMVSTSTSARIKGFTKNVKYNLNQSELILNVNDTYQLSVNSNIPSISSQPVTWNSSRSDVIEVNGNGKILVKKEGFSEISATSQSGLIAKCFVYVSDKNQYLPKIDSYEIIDKDDSGYTVKFNMISEIGLGNAAAAVWSESGGQDDLKYHDFSIKGNEAQVRVNVGDHNFESGNYISHIFAYDRFNNFVKVILPTQEIPISKSPEIQDLKISDITKKGYKVKCKTTNVRSVLIAVWTEQNGQDDLQYHKANIDEQGNVEFDLDISTHNFESGKYITHVYAYNAQMKSVYAMAEKVEILPLDKPQISNVQVSDKSATGFTITADIEAEAGVSHVQMPTWSEKNGQDDLTWGNATINGNTISYRVNTSEHFGEGGKYNTHIYLYDNTGKSTKQVVETIVPEPAMPKISNVQTAKDATGFTITADVEAELGVSHAQMPAWSEKNGQDDLTWGNATITGNKLTYRVNINEHKNEFGNYITHIYMYDKAGRNVRYVLNTKLDEPGAPKISNVKVSDKSATGFTITADIEAEAGVSHVQMPTWSERNGQDDLTWGNATINANTISYRVNTSEHFGEGGKYITHIYLYDKAGRNVKHVLETLVPEPAMPKISNVQTAKDTTGFTITADIEAEVGVSHAQMPTWSEKNGQDDLTWGNATITGNKLTYRVNINEHKNEFGDYVTHIYFYDKAGRNVRYVLNTTLDEPGAPKISNVQTAKDTTGFTITADIEAEAGVSHAQMPTWSEKNGQDDLTWGNATMAANKLTYRVNINEHKNEYGKYITHIYLYDKAGRSVRYVLNTTLDEPAMPKISNIQSTEDATGFTITADIEAEVGVSHVQVPTWSEKNGQDDLIWGSNATITGNKITYRVNISDHNNEYGKYITHIYIYDKMGRSTKYILETLL